MRTPVSLLERKIEAISAFRSQKQIDSIIKVVKNAGPEEYLRLLEFKLYNPREYRDLFEESETINSIHR